MSLFGNPSASSTGSLFGNPTGQSKPPASTGLFGNPTTATTTPSTGLFGNPNPFGATTTTPGTGLFGNPTPTTQPQPSTSLFGNPGTTTTAPTTGSLFSNPTTQQPAQSSLFGNPSVPATTSSLFTQPQSQVGLFQTTATAPSTIPQQMPTNLFSSTINPNDIMLSQQQQNQRQQVLSYIMNYKQGTLKDIFGSQLNSLIVPQSNLLKNSKVKMFDNQNLTTIMIALYEKIINLERKTEQITVQQHELFDILENCHKLVLDKMKLYKQAFLEVTSHSGYINEIKDMLEKMQYLVGTEFRNFVQGIKSNRNIMISKPSTFQYQLSQLMLQQSKTLFQQICQYQSCQDESSQTSVLEVISLLIQYYKNVSCLVYQFKQKYRQSKQELLRNRYSTSRTFTQQLSSNIKQQQKNWIVFDRLFEVQKTIDTMSIRLKQMKQKFKLKLDKLKL